MNVRILFITLTNIGDAVISTALLNRVLEDNPRASVDIVVGPKAAPFFEGLPQLNELIPLVKQKHHKHYLSLWKKLRQNKYDLIIDLRTALLARCLHGRQKIIYKPHNNANKVKQVANLWDSDRPIQLKGWAAPEVKAKVEEFLAQHETGDAPVIAIAPTANWICKQWPQKGFKKLVEGLEENHSDQKPFYLVLGANEERHTINDFLSSIPKNRLIDMVGKTTLPEAFAWLSCSDYFVGNDSGLAHLAAAAGIPTVTLFGPTREDLYAPYNNKGVVIQAKERLNSLVNLEPEAPRRLITDIAPHEVLTTLEKLMRQYPSQKQKEVKSA